MSHERVPRQDTQSLRRHAPAPKRCAQPVRHLRGYSLDIIMEGISHASCDCATHLHGEESLRVHLTYRSDEAIGIVDRVRVGKPIAEVDPDPPIVGLRSQTLAVVWPPRPK